MNTWLRRPLVKLCLGLLVVLIAISSHIAHSRSVSAESSVSSAELFNLRTRVNRLESEVRRFNQSNFRDNISERRLEPSPSVNIGPPPVVDGQVIGPTDPRFQRLATLVIELKERVVMLEEKTAELQQRLNAAEQP